MEALHMAICICVFGIFGKQLPRVDSIFDKVLALFACLTNKANTEYALPCACRFRDAHQRDQTCKYANKPSTQWPYAEAHAPSTCTDVYTVFCVCVVSANWKQVLKMNWDNETVLKFLELYQINSCIWDPQNDSHKNRQRVNDAWNNIKENLGVACTVKDLKKKKESLMSAYRNYKTKIKKSERSGSGSSDIYKPTWFAFSCMDGFLGSVYTCNTTRSTEDEETIEDTDTTTNTIVTDELNESNPTTSNQEPSSMTPTPPVRRRQKNPPELIEAKQHMERAFNFMKQVSQEQHHPKNLDDESEIFGQLIARKIRKLSEERRDIMMVKINQLFVDEHMLNSPISPYSASTITLNTPSPPQFQEVYSPQSQTQTAPMEELHTTRSYSTREFIIPNTIYDGPADTLKDFVIFKPK